MWNLTESKNLNENRIDVISVYCDICIIGAGFHYLRVPLIGAFEGALCAPSTSHSLARGAFGAGGDFCAPLTGNPSTPLARRPGAISPPPAPIATPLGVVASSWPGDCRLIGPRSLHRHRGVVIFSVRRAAGRPDGRRPDGRAAGVGGERVGGRPGGRAGGRVGWGWADAT